MHKLTTIILKHLEARHGAAYTFEKADRLKDERGFDVLFWATHALDAKNQQTLRNSLGISREEWDATSRVMKLVYNL